MKQKYIIKNFSNSDFDKNKEKILYEVYDMDKYK